MSANSEIMKLLTALTKDMKDLKIAIKELQEDNASSAVTAENMYKTLNVKFDIFKNLEAQSRETIQQTSATPRKATRPVFFKNLFLNDREKYINVLYTQEEIDAAYQEKDVIAKKKPSDKDAKVSTIIYANHIKANHPEGRASAFASIYDQLSA